LSHANEVSGKCTRNTRQKRLILDCLTEHSGEHITAEGILGELKAKRHLVGKATVYRYLKQLESEGQIKRYSIAEGVCACYQYIGPNSSCNEHYHLVCSRCGGVTHIESDIIKRFVKAVRQSDGFAIDERKMVFYGICKSCVGI